MYIATFTCMFYARKMAKSHKPYAAQAKCKMPKMYKCNVLLCSCLCHNKCKNERK